MNQPHQKPRQLRKHYAANRKRSREKRARMFANMRAAKDRKRIERLSSYPEIPDMSHVEIPRPAASGFRITVECLDDGERASFTAVRLPWGLAISPTAAGRKVARVLKEYLPGKAHTSVIYPR